jgi:AAA domain
MVMGGNAMLSPQELLNQAGIRLARYAPGNHSTTCPQCSAKRSQAHQRTPCLSVKIDGAGATWHCHHCQWRGPEKGIANGNGHDRERFAATHDYHDASGTLRFQKVRNPPGSKARFFLRQPDGNGGWINNTRGTSTDLLYRLPELIEAIASGHMVAVVEGEGDADALWRIGIPATTSAHGAADPSQTAKWNVAHSEQLRGADIVVFNDNDPPGYAHAKATCDLSVGIASRIRRLDLAKHWPEIPKKGGDVSDWLRAGHTREQLDALIERAPDYSRVELQLDGAAQPKRFKLIPFDQITMRTGAIYLVEDIIPRTGLVVIWGPYKCGKSFWTFDVFMHVALGWEYRGRRVQQGPVVYIALEGGDGFRDRKEAFCQKFLPENHGPVPFHLIINPLNLIKDVGDLISSIREDLGAVCPVAVVIDTLNRSLVGSESDDRDMAAYIRAADAIGEAFGCVVPIVHHCGIEGTRPRGHTSLTGAAAAQLSVKRDAASNVIVEVEWMKDGAEGEIITSRLDVVTIGINDHRKPITSCVVVPAEDAQTNPPKTKQPRLAKAANIALRALREAVEELGTVPPASNHIPANVRTVTIEQWRTYAYQRGISAGEERAQQRAFKRAITNLIADQHVAIWNEQAWPAKEPT